MFRLISKEGSKPIWHRAADADGVFEAGSDLLVRPGAAATSAASDT